MDCSALAQLDANVHRLALAVDRQRHGVAGPMAIQEEVEVHLAGNFFAVHRGKHIAAELQLGGDVLTAVDGKEIASQMDLNLLLNRHRPGDAVTLTIYRERQSMDVRVKLGER